MGAKPFGVGLYTSVEQYTRVLRTQEQTGEKAQLTEEKRRKKEQEEKLKELRRQLTKLAVATTKPPISTTLTDILRRSGWDHLDLGRILVSDERVPYGIYTDFPNKKKIFFYQGGRHCPGLRDFVQGATMADYQQPLTPQQYERDLRAAIRKATSELRE